MAKSAKKDVPIKKSTLSKFQQLSLFFFQRPRKTAFIWLVVAVFGALCYTTILKREGFPSVETPFASAGGAYIVNDPARVDKDVAKPLSEFLIKQEGVKTVQTQSFDNFYNAVIAYDEGVNADTLSKELTEKINQANIIPDQASLKLEDIAFGFTLRGDDLVVSFYAEDNAIPAAQLGEKTKEAENFLNQQNISHVESLSVIDQFETAPSQGGLTPAPTQKSFDRYGKKDSGQNKFYTSVPIGIMAKPGTDNIELHDEVQRAVENLNYNPAFKGYHADISASYAPQIKEQVSELQGALLAGLIAILVVGSIVIAIRASLITVVAMVTVISITNALIFMFGYTLNTITLFALILGLALIVDDTIIMVEAIDAQRRKRKDAKKAVTTATGKVSRAMIAATSTAALSFAPLLFVGGILGSFIRAIPITIISALLTSLLVALIFIPFFARFLLLGKKQMGEGNVREIAAGVEAGIARTISRPMLWAKGSSKKLFGVGIAAVLIGFIFIGAGGALFQKVKFNIFPPSKDANQLSVTLTFPPATDINKAQEIAADAEEIASEAIGDKFVHASYYGNSNVQSATLIIDIIDYKDRDIRAPEIIDQLKDKFRNFDDGNVSIRQIDAGPPAAAFAARIDSSQNRAGAINLAEDIAEFLKKTELKRVDGSIAKVDTVAVGNPGVYNRDDAKAYIETGATFSDTDTTTLVTLAKTAIEKEFTAEKVASYGLDKSSLYFDSGQEDENQESFKTLAYAFPAVLALIFILLALQFKSLLQPLLIFMAIPFSLFGITLGLYLTDNPFSFFAMMGFFALIGLSIKNTILLTDYANQARAAGMGPVDAAHAALAERFRPLIATSLTAVVSLIPLAITSPFWEGLSVVLIGGLLSSTFLVVTVFPYYYLGAEYLRSRISRKIGLLWVVLIVVLAAGLFRLAPQAALGAPLIATAVIRFGPRLVRRK